MHRVILLLLIFLTALSGGCGRGTSQEADQVPQGRLMGSGGLSAVDPSVKITGVAYLYQTGPTSFVVRFESLNAPNLPALQVFLDTTSGSFPIGTLRPGGGNQNYSASVASGGAILSVSIKNTARTPYPVYAVAQFPSAGGP